MVRDKTWMTKHVMQLDDGNSQVSLAYVDFPSHNQTYIVAMAQGAPW